MSNSVHEAEHAVYLVEQVAIDLASGLDVVMPADTNHSDVCIHASCGHASALLVPVNAFLAANTLCAIPAFHHRWCSNATFSNIERPKWALTTPAVVSLLI